jgi:adenylate cyclase
LGASNAEAPEQAELLERHEAFIAAWQTGNLADARSRLKDLLALPQNPLSGTHALYAGRLSDLPDAAPEGWDGVFTASSK